MDDETGTRMMRPRQGLETLILVASTYGLVFATAAGWIFYNAKCQPQTETKIQPVYRCRDCAAWSKQLEQEFEAAQKTATLTRYFPDFEKYHEDGHKLR